ncbi:MAG: HD domain-containing protein [Lachnospiraceae bacterium]|jgi:uncharacterized protein|nr:HD domain-containing protein [Lachnospiraceae bacterium]MDD3617031.1 HD domain-containing protein [Lachnospiraceae bacterium]
MERKEKLFLEMISYYGGDPCRLQHFTKVHAYARLMGIMESLTEKEQEILEAAAYVHDVGIKAAEEKFGSSNGKLQEQEGPAVAKEMLEELGYEPDIVERVCYLVAHHHTYTNMDGMDYQILVEADFLVNLYEDHSSKESILHAYDKIFRTESGRQICRDMFAL